jgi:hypothetical protein
VRDVLLYVHNLRCPYVVSVGINGND